MAAARQRAEWMRTGWLLAGIRVAVWGKESLSPVEMIPPAFRPERPGPRQMSPEERAEESKLGWAVVNRAMRAMSGKKKQGNRG